MSVGGAGGCTLGDTGRTRMFGHCCNLRNDVLWGGSVDLAIQIFTVFAYESDPLLLIEASLRQVFNSDLVQDRIVEFLCGV